MVNKLSNTKNVTIMIQARTSSHRFPKKVLSKIENYPMIWHVINRIKTIEIVDKIVLITTTDREDKKLVRIANESNIESFVGHPTNVLKRHYDCALKFDADPIIRITGDCPLIDPNITEMIIDFFQKNNFDYVSNTIDPTYPDGLDTEVFSFKALEMAHQKAKLSSDLEHVTTFITKNPDIFKSKNYENNTDLSNLRWTIDYPKDLELIRKIYGLMKPELVFSMHDIISVLDKNPNFLNINSKIKRNEGYLKSLENDKKL